VKLFCFDGKPIKRKRAQKNTVKPHAEVLIDNIHNTAKAVISGRHQSADSVYTKRLLCSLDALHRQVVAVSSWTWTVLIVEISRPIKQRGQQNIVLLAERQVLVIK
jgi:hypothetical protein